MSDVIRLAALEKKFNHYKGHRNHKPKQFRVVEGKCETMLFYALP